MELKIRDCERGQRERDSDRNGNGNEELNRI